MTNLLLFELGMSGFNLASNVGRSELAHLVDILGDLEERLLLLFDLFLRFQDAVIQAIDKTIG